jgi:hypothetical protein
VSIVEPRLTLAAPPGKLAIERGKLHSWLGCRGPHRDRQDRLECWRVFSGTGIAVMGSVRVTTLHPRRPGDPELSPVPEVAPSSSKDSSRAVHRDGDLM